MECYACDEDATRHCPRCGKPYCPEHGDDLCADCLDPMSAAPSSAVFRTSLFALLAASVVALWLLVRPPSLPGEGSAIALRNTVTPAPTMAPFSPGATLAPTPGAATPTPAGAGTPTPAPTPAPT